MATRKFRSADAGETDYLRMSHRNVYARRDVRGRYREAALFEGTWRHGDSDYADRGFCGTLELGIRRRLSLCARSMLWTARRHETSYCRRPSKRFGGDSRRRLQPFRARRELLGELLR